MRGRTINRGKAGIGFIEDKVEIRARQHDRFDAITTLEVARSLAQFSFVCRRNVSLVAKPR